MRALKSDQARYKSYLGELKK